LKPLLELLFEMLSESTFDEKELRKEKQVVYEEMQSSLEDPQEMAYDLFYQACYAPHSLGYPIVGNRKVLSRMGKEKLLDLYDRNYTLSDSVLVTVGDIDGDDLMNMFPARIGLRKGERKERPGPSGEEKPASLVHTRSDLSQVYAFMGVRTTGLESEERFALALLATLLGGGMSSRLFFSLREDKGLVYTVSSLLELFENTGLFGFFFITEKPKLSTVFRTIEREISHLKKKGLGTEELQTAKTLTKSALILNMESLSNRMSRLGKWKLLPQRFRSITETIETFERVTEDQVLEVARKYFDSKPFYTSFVGPVTEQDTNPLTRR
jgi:predicted Zn-dependent peptidase